MKSSGRRLETWSIGLEDCWGECSEGYWFNKGAFYTFVHPALVDCRRYSCIISEVCKSSWLTHESLDDG